ncbi:MoaD/ThiS family protein [Aestuariibacter halophilus]|uniref:Molybdopterin synthase sulfur carrier subunit n=1 Tax=Fluctibacter halophilus TaxID=226011 RepID=A0ABS8G5B0_9ALTE|nr:MoaD/ThiS family protein [Aestuariibacter halophilus]MCC2615060.1 MoaD/ThiS family protein [Aestuariibacter halophilus]
MIKILFFGQLKERLECADLNLEYAGEHTVVDVVQQLLERGEVWRPLAENDVLVAVNHTICAFDATVRDGDEIAFFPPVTGG